jgi:hypothetical protein
MKKALVYQNPRIAGKRWIGNEQKPVTTKEVEDSKE